MAQRTRRVEISLRSVRTDVIELTDADLMPIDGAAEAEAEVDLEITSFDVDLGALCAEPPASQRTPHQRARLGKETLAILAPVMVRQLARPAGPPPRFPRSAGMLMAAAALATVLLSASVALAWT